MLGDGSAPAALTARHSRRRRRWRTFDQRQPIVDRRLGGAVALRDVALEPLDLVLARAVPHAAEQVAAPLDAVLQVAHKGLVGHLPRRRPRCGERQTTSAPLLAQRHTSSILTRLRITDLTSSSTLAHTSYGALLLPSGPTIDAMLLLFCCTIWYRLVKSAPMSGYRWPAPRTTSSTLTMFCAHTQRRRRRRRACVRARTAVSRRRQFVNAKTLVDKGAARVRPTHRALAGHIVDDVRAHDRHRLAQRLVQRDDVLKDVLQRRLQLQTIVHRQRHCAAPPTPTTAAAAPIRRVCLNMFACVRMHVRVFVCAVRAKRTRRQKRASSSDGRLSLASRTPLTWTAHGDLMRTTHVCCLYTQVNR